MVNRGCTMRVHKDFFSFCENLKEEPEDSMRIVTRRIVRKLKKNPVWQDNLHTFTKTNK